mgnify:CR=1 FL=1
MKTGADSAAADGRRALPPLLIPTLVALLVAAALPLIYQRPPVSPADRFLGHVLKAAATFHRQRVELRRLGVQTTTQKTASNGAACAPAQLNATIAAAAASVAASQHAEDKPFTAPFVGWGYSKGGFPSDLIFNFVEPAEDAQFLRDFSAIPDNNGFVNPFILHYLAEVTVFAADLWNPTDFDSMFAAAVRATAQCKDLRVISDPRIAALMFWPQVINESTAPITTYKSFAVNLASIGEYFIQLNATLPSDTPAWVYRVIDVVVSRFGPEQLDPFITIPADVDDSSTFYALKAWLANFRHLSRPLVATESFLSEKAFDTSALFRTWHEFSLCPATSADADSTWIDPRTYYYARQHFRALTNASSCIPTTWMTNVELDRSIAIGGVDPLQHWPMAPHVINNIDPVVAADGMLAMTIALLFDTKEAGWFSNGRQMYAATVAFVVTVLTSQANGLIPNDATTFLYYPLPIMLPLYAARTMKILNDAVALDAPLPFPELNEAFAALSGVMQMNSPQATSWAYLLSRRKTDAQCTDYPGRASPSAPVSFSCWDGFVGGKDSPNHHLDRAYATAVAVTALLDSFTFSQPTPSDLQWFQTVPVEVTQMITSGLNFLYDVASYDPPSFQSVFFSGDNQLLCSKPQSFPFTDKGDLKVRWPNETCQTVVVDNVTPTTLFAVNVQPGIPEDTYVNELDNGCPPFGKVPCGDINEPENTFAFWSSTQLTKAMIASALGKGRKLGVGIVSGRC